MTFKQSFEIYLEGPLTDAELRRHRQLIIRELNNPSEAFELTANRTLRPLFEHLHRFLSPFVPDGEREG